MDVSLASGTVLGSTFTRRGLSAWIYFGSADGPLNLSRFEQLDRVKPQIEIALGQEAVWDAMDGRKAAGSALNQNSLRSRTSSSGQ